MKADIGITNKTFSPGKQQKHRNCNTVRRRAINYLLTLREMSYTNELPLDEAIDLFSQITDQWDRLTIKAYFGTKKHTSRKKIFRQAVYGNTGIVSNKDITLIQDIPTTPGYLEKMGLVTYNLKGNIWFMKVENRVLIPQLMKAESSMKNISLSSNSILQGKECEKTDLEVVSPNVETIEIEKKLTNNNLQNERDKLVYKSVYEEALAILNGSPCEETDRAKVKWHG